ncbi:MAG: LysR family transcriptional regulator, partial [Rhizobiales bacterium]|nr:LysR family transcriptional regulator [Rhizobacter sp.]
MRSQLLKSFVVVAETLHFARAAAMLGMAQATLSQQVAALESFLEVQLIWRDNRNVRLTPAGE